MRIDKLTNQLQNALADAQSIAVGNDHSAIEPVHLLLALLNQQGGSVRPILNRAGFDVQGLQQELNRQLDNLAKISSPTGDANLSQDLFRSSRPIDGEILRRDFPRNNYFACLGSVLTHPVIADLNKQWDR